MVIDRRTGKIYNAPDANQGYSFRAESNMLIVNPPEADGFYPANCAYCKPVIYIFDTQSKIFKKLDPKEITPL
jgi:hypothetical protein